MSEKRTLEELHLQLAPLEGYIGAKLKHIATNSFYRVTSVHFREADMTIEFAYRSLHRHGVTFSRPIAELMDGRFEVLG